MERIVIDTAQLQATINSLQEDIQGLQQQTGQLAETVSELNAMWTGPAHDTLVGQFAMDMETMANQLDEMNVYNDSLADARKQYNNCDEWVRNTIAAIHL